MLNEIVKNITTYVLLSSKLGLMTFGPTRITFVHFAITFCYGVLTIV